jgi:hypothetical protein
MDPGERSTFALFEQVEGNDRADPARRDAFTEAIERAGDSRCGGSEAESGEVRAHQKR